MPALNFDLSECSLRLSLKVSRGVTPPLWSDLFTPLFNTACNTTIFFGFCRLSTAVDKIVRNSLGFSTCKTMG